VYRLAKAPTDILRPVHPVRNLRRGLLFVASDSVETSRLLFRTNDRIGRLLSGRFGGFGTTSEVGRSETVKRRYDLTSPARSKPRLGRLTEALASCRVRIRLQRRSGPPQPRQLPFGPLMSMRLTTAHYARRMRQFIQRLTGVALNLLPCHGWTLHFPAPGYCLGSCRPTFQVRQETRSLSRTPEPHSTPDARFWPISAGQSSIGGQVPGSWSINWRSAERKGLQVAGSTLEYTKSEMRNPASCLGFRAM
jgi:hypothetical protein